MACTWQIRVDLMVFQPKAAAKKAESFIRGYFRGAKRKKAIIGLSGGLDSAAAAALCCRALGPKNAIGVLLPSASTPNIDIFDAQLLAKKLGMRTRAIPIECVLRSFSPILPSRLSRANFLARIRMAILYSIAQEENGLVVGTGDKSEFLLGYFTKYGDGGADLFPLGGMYKTEVRSLARHLRIPPQIIRKPSSPALYPGQTAEGELGFAYETADRILAGIEGGESRASLCKRFAPKTVAAILSRMEKNRHKLFPAPICRI